jgi:hypothetical protein
MIPYRLMVVVFLVAMLAYTGLGRAAFTMPTSPEAAQECGIILDDFDSDGQIEITPTQAWWMSFVNKHEYWNAISAGLVGAFLAFVISAARRLGAGVASGAVVGGGLLAFLTICLGCLAPVLSVVGLGIGGSMLAGFPKWLMTIITLLLTGGGTLYLFRRLTACSLKSPQCTQTAGNQACCADKVTQK